jgi:hypothetical protein
MARLWTAVLQLLRLLCRHLDCSSHAAVATPPPSKPIIAPNSKVPPISRKKVRVRVSLGFGCNRFKGNLLFIELITESGITTGTNMNRMIEVNEFNVPVSPHIISMTADRRPNLEFSDQPHRYISDPSDGSTFPRIRSSEHMTTLLDYTPGLSGDWGVGQGVGV